MTLELLAKMALKNMREVTSFIVGRLYYDLLHVVDPLASPRTDLVIALDDTKTNQEMNHGYCSISVGERCRSGDRTAPCALLET